MNIKRRSRCRCCVKLMCDVSHFMHAFCAAAAIDEIHKG